MPETLDLRDGELKGTLGDVGAAARSLPRRAAFAVLPLLSTALLIPALLLLAGHETAFEGLRLAVLGCLSAGKLVLLEAGRSGSFEPFLLAGVVFYVDLCFAFPLAYNLEVFHGLPKAGPLLRRLESHSRALLHRSPAGKALTYAGLALFVAIPLGGSGAVGGAFFGRLLGLSRSRTLSGIALGSFAGNAALATGAYLWPQGWLQRFLEQPLFGILGAAATLVVVGLLMLRLRGVSVRVERHGGAHAG